MGEPQHDFVNVNITSNLNSYQTERRFSSSISVLALKGKLELVIGGNMNTMNLELRNKDEEVITSMSDDSMTLAQYGVESGMTIHVIDHESNANGGGEEETELAFQLSEEEYAKREESARLFLMRNKLGKYDDKKIQKKEEEEANESLLALSIPVGTRCEVHTVGAPPRRGEVKYVGKVHFKAGDWVGVQYDEPVGKNDGQIDGKRYFESRPKYGGFVRPSSVKVGDFPELGMEDLDEI